MDKKNLLNIVFFVGILAVAIGLRVLFLNTDIWYDEACSWFTAKQSFPVGIIHNLLTLDLQHTPLYFFLLHFWIKLFGDFEISMRILSLIFGVATIPMVYLVSKKITTSIVSNFATALAAVSPILTLFSVEVRMYPIVVFLVLVSLNYLIDFEQKNDKKSLLKLIIADVLIPYTLVGGFLYNFSVYICYSIYLFKNKKEQFLSYIKAVGIELILLVPYFYLINYYAKMRSVFVITHEGELQFFHIVDVIRNYFGTILVNNVYWPSEQPYAITVLFTTFVIVPCVYFVVGLIKSFKDEDKFVRILSTIFVTSFTLSVIFSLFKVNVFTSRYILYLLPPLFILSVIGLFQWLSKKHCVIFLSLFIVFSTIFTLSYVKTFRISKTRALKSVRIEADRWNLNSDDMVIMPFASDAPYYFRNLTSPRVFNFDFHKEVRNPYNNHFYDKTQQDGLKYNKVSKIVYFAAMSDSVISQNYFKYFVENVNMTVPKSRYVMLALYGDDAKSLVTPEQMKAPIHLENDVNKNLLGIMFQKYLIDTRSMLDADFNFIKGYTQDNYTFLIYQKK